MSGLQRAAEEYLAVRRALGYKLGWQGRVLLQFVDYLDESHASVITTALALAWARQPESSQLWWNQRLSVVRGFARYVHGVDPRTEVPATDLLPARFRRAVPHLYSEAEIAQLMEAARKTIRSPLRAATYETLLGLLAVTGLRVGEAIGLDRDDVDIAAGVLVVRCAKGGNSREVPLHASTVDALGAYARRRDELCPRVSSPSFLVSIAGTRLDRGSVWHEFDRLRRLTGLSGRPGSRPPRMHDLRHSFVLRTLLNWYGAGANVEAQLPLLSVYLGHVDPSSTYWYFEAAPELLALAAERLERAWEDRP
jgi:site-specific recombinase XerD